MLFHLRWVFLEASEEENMTRHPRTEAKPLPLLKSLEHRSEAPWKSIFISGKEVERRRGLAVRPRPFESGSHLAQRAHPRV